MSEVPRSDIPRGPYDIAIYLAKLLEVTAAEGVQAEHEASHDKLTGALNRNGLHKYLESATAPKALLWLDSTNFKAVNDRFGHIIGDKVIVDTYDVLKASVRPDDVIARWGGDEWVVILNGDNQIHTGEDFADDKRQNRTHIEHIEPVKERIAQQMQTYLAQHPELVKDNFDLAVGGIEWSGDLDIESLIENAENDMGIQKREQHKKGQHRTALAE